MQKLKQTLFIGLLSLLFLNPVFAVAAGNTNANVNTNSNTSGSTAINVPEYTGVQGSITQFLCTPSEGKADGKDLERCINKLYRFGIAFGGIALVFFLVYAGYIYIVGGESGKGKAKGVVQNAIVGIALLLGSYVILYFINPNLTIIKPIQPPIFTAGDFPKCEEVGFEETCVLPSGEIQTGSGEGGWGERISCPGNKLVSAKGLGLPTKAADEQICEEFGKKLLGLKTSLTGVEWRITDTIGSGHGSSCHSSGNNLSGTCADIGITVKSTDNFNKVCKALMAIGDLQPVNETEDPAVTECGKLHNYGGTGPHLHVNWRKGNGGGGGGTSSGGSRPYCRPIHKFLCDHPANDSGRADPHVWTSSFPEVQANLNELKKVCGTDSKKCMGYPIDQVYRSPEYGAHMRSIFEAYVILYEGWSDSKISRYGQYCDGTIQYVKTSDLKGVDKNSEVGKYIKAHFNGSAKHFSSTGSPTTCMSNHGLGIALDFTSAPPESSVVGPGKLCHNIPPGTNGISAGDAPHYILYSKKRSGEKCTF